MEKLISQRDQVHTGFWVNHLHGNVKGSTLTLSTRNSAVFIAFIALFVGFAGSQLWSVLTFLISTSRSTAKPQDGFYHQQQAILRNTAQPSAVAWAMLRLSWFWKDSATRPRMRAYVFVFSSLVYVAIFSMAGLFSAKITSNNSEVLARPIQDCGDWYYPFLRDFNPAKTTFKEYTKQRQNFWIDFNQLFKSSHTHMVQCYNSTFSQPNEMCLSYGRNEIEWSRNPNIPCPFDEGICLTDAIQFDTGFMSSSVHYGIDIEGVDIKYRRVMTCAPITTDGHVSGYYNIAEMGFAVDTQTYAPLEGETYLKYTYGPGGMFDDNTTYAYSNFSFPQKTGWNSPIPVFDLDVELSSVHPEELMTLVAPSFEAMPALSLPDADTQLIFLSRNATYLDPVNDPWFKSTKASNSSLTFTNGAEYLELTYSAEEPVGVMACAEQHQLRNPKTGVTSHLGGMEVAVASQALKLGFDENQMAIFNRTFAVGSNSVLSVMIPALGASSLLAMDSQGIITLPALPDDQWHQEMEHYFGVLMLSLQLWSQQYATGRTQPEFNKYNVLAATDIEKAMCTSQVVRRVDYRSFSVLGISIIFVLGLLFTIANLVVVPITEHFLRRSSKGTYCRAEWQANDFLQLQRMAYEHKGIGTWSGQGEVVPRTKFGEVFTIPTNTEWHETTSTPEVRNHQGESKSLSSLWLWASPAVNETSDSPTLERLDPDNVEKSGAIISESTEIPRSS